MYAFDDTFNYIPFFAYAPNGKCIVSGAGSVPSLRLVDTNTGMQQAALDLDGNRVARALFSPDGAMVAAITVHNSFDPTATVLSSNPGAIYLVDGNLTKKLKVLETKLPNVRTLAFSPDNRTLAAAGGDWGGVTAIVLDVQTGKILHSLSDHAGGITSMAFSPDGNMLAIGHGHEEDQREATKGGLRVWNPRTGALIVELK